MPTMYITPFWTITLIFAAQNLFRYRETSNIWRIIPQVRAFTLYEVDSTT